MGPISSIVRPANSGRYWKFKALLFILAVALLRTIPAYTAVESAFVKSTWQSAQLKFDHPLTDMARVFPPASHEAKLTFRMTVPLVAHVMRLTPGHFLVLNALLGILLLYLVLTIAHRIVQDPTIALLTTLSIACAWPGQTAFHELRGGYYDAAALCLLLLASSARTNIAVALWTFLAVWTDERALLAVPLALFVQARRKPMIVASAAYILIRLALATQYSTPTAGLGVPVFLNQLSTLPLGLWTGLGGAWVPIVAALRTQPWKIAAALTPLLLAASLVVDITRTAAYCLPAVFVALSLLKQNRHLEILAAIAASLSLLLPSFYVEGQGIYWLRY